MTHLVDQVCTIDWGLIAAWVGALATVGLVVAAVYGLGEWKSQFLKTRDHDLARRILKTIADSLLIFDELRTPHALMSDNEGSFDPHNLEDMDGSLEHHQMSARYRARSRHLATVRKERAAVLLETAALWGDNNEYSVGLGILINQLGPLESAVIAEATKFVDNLVPNAVGEPVNRAVLFKPMDADAVDAHGTAYLAIRNEIIRYLGPRIRMASD